MALERAEGMVLLQPSCSLLGPIVILVRSTNRNVQSEGDLFSLGHVFSLARQTKDAPSRNRTLGFPTSNTGQHGDLVGEGEGRGTGLDHLPQTFKMSSFNSLQF